MKPWDKPHPMARKCAYCGSQKPGMQPLRLNGKRGYWHLKCFEKAKEEMIAKAWADNRSER
jgi:hypothetical protein